MRRRFGPDYSGLRDAMCMQKACTIHMHSEIVRHVGLGPGARQETGFSRPGRAPGDRG
jgi:hypothetical protein